MEIFVKITSFADADQLRRKVEHWEAAGVSGVAMSDHLFSTLAARAHSSANAMVRHDAHTVLAAAGAFSSALKLAAVVSNVGLTHPALIIRRFAELAMLYGGDRVYAGLGAGWNAAEHASLGQSIAPYTARLDRLEESLALARELFSSARSTRDTASFEVCDFVLSPMPARQPRLLVGGGSERIIELAAKYADHIDLNAPARRPNQSTDRQGGARNPQLADQRRRLRTTDEDLAESGRALEDAAARVGRQAASISRSISLMPIRLCTANQARKAVRAMCSAAGIGEVDADQCPYLLLGAPDHVADLIRQRSERLRLNWMVLPDAADLDLFLHEVLPDLRPKRPQP